MGDFKIKISDIFRYILLGCIETLLCAVILLPKYFIVKENGAYVLGISSQMNESLTNLGTLSFDPTILILVVALSLFYILGYVTQMVIQLFFRGNYLGTGIGEVACFIKDFPAWYFNRDKYPFPDWIYYSNSPDRAVEIYREILETESDADGKQEFSIANQLFQGLSFSILIFMVFCTGWSAFAQIVVTLLLIVALSWLGRKATSNVGYVVISRVLQYVMPLIVFGIIMIWGNIGISDTAFSRLNVAIVAAAFMLMCNIVAARLSRRQIRRLDIITNDYDDNNLTKDKNNVFYKTLLQIGLPRVYVLTRVDGSTVGKILEEQVASVASQIYPNIKQLLLIDSFNISDEQKKQLKTMVERYVREHGMNIQYSYSKGSGPASLSYEIRQLFIDSAARQDIAICLDSDDKFADDRAVSRIVAKMNMTQSNICIIGFEIFGDINLNNAKNYHNDLVKKIAKDVNPGMPLLTNKRRMLLPERMYSLNAAELIDANEAHHVSTLGWTKCYRKPIAAKYQKLLSKYSGEFNHNCKYEDFPDINSLLLKESRICAVSDTSILFRKRNGSVTTNMTRRNYENITYFLKLAKLVGQDLEIESENKEKLLSSGLHRDDRKFLFLSHLYSNRIIGPLLRHKRQSPAEMNRRLNNMSKMLYDENVKATPELSPDAMGIILERFIPYKFVQYLNGLYKKMRPDAQGNVEIADFSCSDFYKYFVEEIYPGEEKQLQDGIVGVLRDNLVYGIFDDVPAPVKAICNNDDGTLPTPTFASIASAYGLK